MPTDRSGRGDLPRTLMLLWRQEQAPEVQQRAPRQTLTIDRVADAAIRLADAEGLAVVTMRRVAQALDVAPMSRYTYVPGKAELIDLMLDAVLARMPRSRPRSDGWRDRVVAVADDNRALYDRHPWVAAISTTRPVLGPGVTAKYEYELAAFDGIGLDDVTMDAALTFILGFVETCARAALDARAAQHETHMTDAQWWAANEPLLSTVFDTARYPLASRVAAAAGAAHQGGTTPITRTPSAWPGFWTASRPSSVHRIRANAGIPAHDPGPATPTTSRHSNVDRGGSRSRPSHSRTARR